MSYQLFNIDDLNFLIFESRSEWLLCELSKPILQNSENEFEKIRNNFTFNDKDINYYGIEWGIGIKIYYSSDTGRLSYDQHGSHGQIEHTKMVFQTIKSIDDYIDMVDIFHKIYIDGRIRNIDYNYDAYENLELDIRLSSYIYDKLKDVQHRGIFNEVQTKEKYTERPLY